MECTSQCSVFISLTLREAILLYMQLQTSARGRGYFIGRIEPKHSVQTCKMLDPSGKFLTSTVKCAEGTLYLLYSVIVPFSPVLAQFNQSSFETNNIVTL